MDLPSLMVLFARVVDAGSFSGAARELSHAPSAVSKQIAHLEDRVGVRLLNRSKLGVTLTEDGEAFYERCADIRKRIASAEAMVLSMGDHPKGRLHIAATVAFGNSQLMPLMPEFLRANPDVEIAVDLSDVTAEFDQSGADVAIQFTEQIEDKSLLARKLAHNRRVICAAPNYLAEAGIPEQPMDLLEHNCLQLSTVSRFNDWSFLEANGQPLHLRSSFEANSADALYHAALAGTGIARLSTYLVGRDIAEGRLVRLLPDYEDTGSDIYAVYSARRNMPPKVRTFIDFLVAHFTPVPPWERQEAPEAQIRAA